ncbi:RNA-binding S4 domain protein [Alkaliphilus metalliredigens QYMF]|uniref:RQC P-site tRNA stabilizing factor n=1 Tax=Alkaliphilus metalliredigens (strain QYMF) TaxID=293826 RepID=A6TJN5_ALKMQ|nr:RNA-binding S4 domain-containing protein [Alkaliphilus metalliredigens]ABR46403.1 RNA-binding S4 domain protein [Alkaliphilus metalliredigens QYMF]
MRLDKYLKISRIIKRRTVAKEACEGGRVSINGKTAKPGTEVAVGDEIEIRFGDKVLRAEVTRLAEHVKKDEAKEMFQIIENN